MPVATTRSIGGHLKSHATAERHYEQRWTTKDSLSDSRAAVYGGCVAVGFDSTERIVAPFFIGLAERRHRQLDAVEKITPTARREFSFPSPVDVHGERSYGQNKKENDQRQAALQSTKL